MSEILNLFEESEKSPIMTSIIGKIGIIRFIRPKAKNPLSIKTLKILKQSFKQFDSFSKIDAIIFTGSGNTFASGANIKEVAVLDEKIAVQFGEYGQSLMQKIYYSRKQTIAAIDGFCMGGALDLAISCKMRIASPKSFFAHPGAKLGIITGWSGTQILPRLIGRKNALEIFITAKRVDAFEALRIGLIDEISENPLAKAIKKVSK
ncbi:MAG: enoyl-CoA hydratase/isomerase family protein [Acidobacteriota bacterium]|jgi:enoyl-CoA hydratase|nr:enoyl-CoA hydratase/isomerase family protein [Acidobacteriota bacterium]